MTDKKSTSTGQEHEHGTAADNLEAAKNAYVQAETERRKVHAKYVDHDAIFDVLEKRWEDDSEGLLEWHVSEKELTTAHVFANAILEDALQRYAVMPALAWIILCAEMIEPSGEEKNRRLVHKHAWDFVGPLANGLIMDKSTDPLLSRLLAYVLNRVVKFPPNAENDPYLNVPSYIQAIGLYMGEMALSTDRIDAFHGHGRDLLEDKDILDAACCLLTENETLCSLAEEAYERIFKTTITPKMWRRLGEEYDRARKCAAQIEQEEAKEPIAKEPIGKEHAGGKRRGRKPTKSPKAGKNKLGTQKWGDIGVELKIEDREFKLEFCNINNEKLKFTAPLRELGFNRSTSDVGKKHYSNQAWLFVNLARERSPEEMAEIRKTLGGQYNITINRINNKLIKYFGIKDDPPFFALEDGETEARFAWYRREIANPNTMYDYAEREVKTNLSEDDVFFGRGGDE